MLQLLLYGTQKTNKIKSIIKDIDTDLLVMYGGAASIFINLKNSGVVNPQTDRNILPFVSVSVTSALA
ncbi:unnamed protein product [Citrullus colocynthis]|uniref:Phosphoglycerate kinase n=1 Tax=Citrullus colocynthis TaxID=252529 RepID=A0ABP0YIM8_9ROSI